jgi:Fe-S-cluster-containing hydrogenase component 2
MGVFPLVGQGPRWTFSLVDHDTISGEAFMQKSLSIDPGKCTGCLQCEMACSYENEGLFNPAKSRIKVFTFHDQGRFVPYTCTQCDEAWCMQACPVDAIKLDTSTLAKIVDEDICVGCKVCTIACPFGTINYNHDTGKVIKCDLCEGDPECAKACPTEAITYVDSDWTGYDRMKQWAAKTDAGNVASSAEGGGD